MLPPFKWQSFSILFWFHICSYIRSCIHIHHTVISPCCCSSFCFVFRCCCCFFLTCVVAFRVENWLDILCELSLQSVCVCDSNLKIGTAGFEFSVSPHQNIKVNTRHKMDGEKGREKQSMWDFNLNALSEAHVIWAYFIRFFFFFSSFSATNIKKYAPHTKHYPW